jgi:hypothetical protein
MDLPPSGWYPDPYGVPDLLRWWDGSNWTRHTHPGVGGADAADGGGATGGGAQQPSVQATSVQPASVQPQTVQPTTVQPATAQPSAAQPTTGQPAGGGWAARDRVIGDWAGTDWPTGDQLSSTKPPNGPRTEPQPALPDTSVQSPVQATRYQPAVQPTSVQSAVQPTAYQAPVQPTTPQPPVSGGWGPAAAQPTAAAGTGGVGADGTQVLFLGGDAWQVPGGPGGPAQPNLYGYQQAQRRRRLWLMGGLAAGTAVAIAIIVVVATSSSSPGGTTADQIRVSSPPSPTAAATTPAPAPSPTASPSASATPPASVLSDGQSGLSYSELASPWSPTCPSGLDSAFSWSAGESAIAGQINGGQTAWYGEACSGLLPAQYNYTGVSDLSNTTTNVAQTLENAYYNDLDHTPQPVLSQPITVGGQAGWEVEYQMNYTNAAAQGATWPTEDAAVVVVDTGTGNTPVVFFASIPSTLGGQSAVNSLVSSLQLSVVPNASGSPGDDGSPAPDGSSNP